MVRLESDDSKHGPPPEDAELFVLEALEEGTWTAEERLVHADMRTAYEEKRRDLLPARDARTGSSLAAQPAPEGLSTKQVVQAAMQHMVRLTKDLFSADNEWLAMIGADLDDVLTRQRRQGRTATAKARYNAVHAELVAVATKARDFIRHADSLEAQGVDGSREALETPELRSGRPAARRSSEEPRSGGGSGSEVDDPAAELTDWSTACDTIWRGDEHDESRRLNITREAYGYIPRQAGWKRDKPRVSAMKALTTADLHLWLWWVACSDIRGVYESPRAHWPTSFPAHLKQLESSKEMVYDDIVGLTRGKLDKIVRARAQQGRGQARAARVAAR